MKTETKVRLFNIFLSFVPSSKKRKELRTKFISRDVEKKNEKTLAMEYIKNNNSLIVVDSNGQKHQNRYVEGLEVCFSGKNSTVIIHEPFNYTNCTFYVKDDSYIEIFPTEYIVNNLIITTIKNSKTIIGENFSCGGCHIGNHDEPNLEVIIGKDCMFSNEIRLRTCDGHTIYNLSDKKPINISKKGITIGDHVWVGMQVTMLKDVSIPSNTVIGARSVVNKSFDEENTIIVGTPAKVIRKGINWDRQSTNCYTAE